MPSEAVTSTAATLTATNSVPASGQWDVSWFPAAGADGSVSGITVQPDDRILVVGSFAAVGGSSRSLIARLMPYGSTDESFNAAGTAD